MRIELRAGLPFVTVRLRHAEQELTLHDVLLDTGSAGTLFATDSVSAIGLVYEPDDALHRIHGVGGSEFVFMKRVDQVSGGELQVSDFAVEVGAMDYGFQLDGIIGTDFLLTVGAVIDLSTLAIR
jgi:hypothetical protein